MEFLKVAFVLICLLSPPEGHSSQDLPPKCESSTCSHVARRFEFSAPLIEEYIAIDVNGFNVKIPPQPVRMYLTGGTLYVVYKDKSVLVLGAGPIPEDMNINEGSIAGTQLPAITFLRKAGDTEPTDMSDKKVWRFAINQKKHYFENAQNVSYTEFGDTSYFISDSKAQGFSGRAFVTNKKRKHNYLQIDAKRLDFSKFMRIVLSVQ